MPLLLFSSAIVVILFEFLARDLFELFCLTMRALAVAPCCVLWLEFIKKVALLCVPDTKLGRIICWLKVLEPICL